MRITIDLTPAEQDAVEFLIKLRNLTEHADAEAFVRNIVTYAVAAAVGEKKEADRKVLADELLTFNPVDVAAFIKSRKAVA